MQSSDVQITDRHLTRLRAVLKREGAKVWRVHHRLRQRPAATRRMRQIEAELCAIEAA